MKQPDPPTAIICGNDLAALFCIQKLNSMGYKVPNDISVTGYDNAEYSRSALYSITTVEQFFLRIGEVAAKCLLTYINDPDKETTVQYITPKTILRKSLGNRVE
jgi:LacI family transcriptional regulator